MHATRKTICPEDIDNVYVACPLRHVVGIPRLHSLENGFIDFKGGFVELTIDESERIKLMDDIANYAVDFKKIKTLCYAKSMFFGLTKKYVLENHYSIAFSSDNYKNLFISLGQCIQSGVCRNIKVL